MNADWRSNPLARAVVISSCATLLLSEAASVYAAPPSTALPQPGSNWLYSGSATNAVNGNTLTVNQASQKAILNWDSFDIGSQARVLFVQPSANAIALNRIGGTSPSEIFGLLGANGNIYLINNNGILFGAGSQVNVHGLVASTLNIDDNTFLNASLTRVIDDGKAALSGGSAANAMVKVEAGAKIATDSGGQVLMFAPQVSNGGEITTPDGQTILAASKDKVYLAVSSDDPNLRGLLVEVGTGGNVENVGKIVAERGNITLLGLAVNQNGYLRATTSVDANGSIRLLARDQATPEQAEPIRSEAVVSFNDPNAAKPEGYKMLAVANRTGTVTFGRNSTTEVVADESDVARGDAAKVAPDAQAQLRSRVDVEGKTIELQEDSRVLAKGGVINLIATTDPRDPHFSSPTAPDGSRIYLGKNTTLDVSGYDITKPMSSRIVEVELYGKQLQDAPLQRNGILRGAKVRVDIDQGSPLISAQAWQEIKDGIKKDVKERLSAGGNVNLQSRGDVVMSSGTTFDLRGGITTYTGGALSTTKLLSGGQLIDIGSADPNRRYDGIFGSYVETHDKWGKTTYGLGSIFNTGVYNDTFDAGSDAGALTITSQTLYGFDLATLKAAAYSGPTQRAADATPRGGRVSIALGQNNPNAAAQNVLIDAIRRSAELAANASLPPGDLNIAADALSAAGLSGFLLSANGKITLAADARVQLAPGMGLTETGKSCPDACTGFSLTGTALQIDGKVIAPGGAIKLVTTAPQGGDNLGNHVLTLGARSVLDVSGLWINDLLAGGAPTTPLIIDGGSISVSASGDLDIAGGALLRADGGAQLTSAGGLNGGNGGAIALATRARQTGDVGSHLRLDGDVSAYGFNKGGQLSLEANSIQVGGSAPSNSNTLWLDPALFERGGFAGYALSANLHGVDIAAGTVINLRQRNLQIDNLNAAARQATGADLRNFTSVVLLPDWLRGATDLQLSAANGVGTLLQPQGDIRIGTLARINGDPGAGITLNSERSIYIDGVISAPGGSISANIVRPKGADLGYVASQAIWLDTHAQLLARAAQVLEPGAAGLLLGRIWDAGTISLQADRGSVIAAPGSLLDVSGTAFKQSVVNANDLRIGYKLQIVNAAAGAVRLRAAESLAMYGDMYGASAGGDGLGGLLSIYLDANQRGEFATGTDLFPNQYGERELKIGNALPQWSAVAGFGQALPASWKGTGWVSASQIEKGGFSRVELGAANKLSADGSRLAAAGRISFIEDVNLRLSDSLLLDTTNISLGNHRVNLGAASVGIGSSNGNPLWQQSETVRSGSGELTVAGRFIELLGNIGVSGAEKIALNSAGDLRVRSQYNPASDQTLAPATFTTTGNLALQASQIYPTTLSDYLFKLTGADSVFSSTAIGARTPILSAGGALRVQAPVIEHAGVLAAPLGTVELAASRSLHLAAGSMIDVSADGQLIPFGRLQGGDISWIYPINKNKQLIIDQTPEKQVQLSAPQLAMDEGSTISLSGGGDIYGIEAVPGPGGSRDFLDAANANGAFAVIPLLNSPISPFDVLEMRDTGLAIGSTVYLNGANGLPAGEYAVLPAHYALLPGAFLVTPAGTQVAAGATTVRVDGAPMVSGRFGRAFTGQYESQWQGFYVEPGSVARTRTEYREARGDDYFADSGVNLARDAGRISIAAQQQLALNGSINAATQNGRGAQMDIFADLLEVVAAGSAGSGMQGVVQLDAGALSRLGVDSLLLGGTRSRDGSATAIDVKAGSVTVQDGAVLSAPDVILAARDRVAVENNAQINVVGQSRQNDTLLKIRADAQGFGTGALLRVSSAPQTDVARAGTITGPGGVLDIADGARLGNAGALLLDATGAMRFNGATPLPNGSLNISANQISLGDDVGAVGGVVFSNAQLAQMQSVDLRLSSRNSIDFYGPVDFANRRIELNAGALRAMTPGTVRINSADTLQLSNTANIAASTDGTGNGQLVLAARSVELGNARDQGTAMQLSGFQSTRIGAENLTQSVLGQGAFELKTSGALSVFADRIGAGAGADTKLTANGAVSLLRANAQPAPAAATTIPALGAALAITGQSIEHGTAIELASGAVTLHAKGTDGADHVTLLDGSSIDVGGRSIVFPNNVVRTAGGSVQLRADAGDVIAQSGSTVRIGGTAGGDSGALDIGVGNGRILWQGAIDAAAASGYSGGSLKLDAGLLTDIDGWFSRSMASGIDREITMRSRGGDLLLTQNLRAARIDISADSGSLRVQSTLDASGAEGGSISLNAGRDVSLAGTALLRADATGADGRGGRVQMGTSGGELRFEAGSRIAVGGKDDGGLVKLRAPRTAANDDVAVTDAGVMVDGARRIDLEGFSVYQSTVVDNALMNQARSSANAFMNHEAAIKTRLGNLTAQGLLLRPGIEIDSSGDLAVNTAFNFSQWRFGADDAPGVLTLRAAGNLNVNRSLLDGFEQDMTELGMLVDPFSTLLTGPSWDYLLAAGADLGAASASSVRTGTGNLLISNGADVITGDGDIGLHAGGNFKQDDSASQPGLIASLGSIRKAWYDNGDVLGGSFLLPDSGTFNNVELFLVALRQVFYPEHGGKVTISAGKNVSFAKSGNFFSDWFERLGGEYSSAYPEPPYQLAKTTWGILLEGLEDMQRGVAVLGGGDLDVRAGGDVSNLNALVPVTGKQTGVAAANQVALIGGGNASVRAGGDILSPRLLVDKGRLLLEAGGNIGASSGDFNAILGLGDTQATLRARGDIAVDAVFNSTMMPQSKQQVEYGGSKFVENYFFTYSPDAALYIDSVGGSVVLNNKVAKVRTVFGANFAPGITDDVQAFAIYPGQVRVDAAQGDIELPDVNNRMSLFPTADSQLVMNAGQNITGGQSAAIYLPDVGEQSLPRIAAPAADGSFVQRLFGSPSTVLHDAIPVHIADTQPAIINTLSGDIRSDVAVFPFTFNVAKPVRVSAGRDLASVSFNIQHNRDSDTSELVAGRDLGFPLVIDRTTGQFGNYVQQIIGIDGPGRLDVIAGRNIDLGGSVGIESRGNRGNGALPDSGADITVMAGINGPSALTDPILYNLFSDRYLSAAAGLGGSFIDWFARTDFSRDFKAFKVSELITSFTGVAYPDQAQALAAFAQLPALQRQAISLEAWRATHAGEKNYAADLVNFVSFERFAGDLAAAANAVLQPAQPFADNASAAAALALLPAVQQQQIALRAFNAAPALARRELLLSVLFSEVRAGGVENSNGLAGADAGFARSRAAIAAMFPDDRSDAWRGNLSLVLSAIRTLGDGDINILVPGGDVNVGLAGIASLYKQSGELGILTQRYGEINAIASGNFNVNQSRVFSLDGGDMLLWSSNGDIDAGKGAKSALTIPPPTIKQDPVTGNLIVEFPPAVAGSGIQAASNNRKRAIDRGALVAGVSSGSDTYRSRQRFFRSLGAGNTYLLAPSGVVNAGDAGIQAGGNLLIAAQKVLGADNISVGGVAVGVPTTTAVSAGTLSLGNVAASATESAANAMNEAMRDAAATVAERGVAFVTVDIIGIGQ